jgi:hypothetical protein
MKYTLLLYFSELDLAQYPLQGEWVQNSERPRKAAFLLDTAQRRYEFSLFSSQRATGFIYHQAQQTGGFIARWLGREGVSTATVPRQDIKIVALGGHAGDELLASRIVRIDGLVGLKKRSASRWQAAKSAA